MGRRVARRRDAATPREPVDAATPRRCEMSRVFASSSLLGTSRVRASTHTTDGKQEHRWGSQGFRRSAAFQALQAPKSMKTGRNEASQFQAGIFRILGVSSSEKQENRKIFGKTKGSGDLPHLRRFKLRKAGKREETKLLNFRRGSSAF